ncbi:hypothetical protein B0T18DRAFT_392286 [Schizothecium vesticola]|uniref:Uncharacterized protein n=1 Tax=Schizothecium vesticola TaxID=314040 RepID=A0AA40EQ98_9PEZI|nr:hypothetical protein B0T18DRAFT_392286 [Schizothecium vesticola]
MSSSSPQSGSSSASQSPKPRPSWPRPRKARNTAPAAPSSAQTAFGSPSSAGPARASTEPIRRNGKSERLVRIHAYRISWEKLRLYLETQLNCELSSPSSQFLMNDDYFSVWLPRELGEKEWQDIDALRRKDPEQQKRIDERLDQTPSRLLDSDEEEDQAGHP